MPVFKLFQVEVNTPCITVSPNRTYTNILTIEKSNEVFKIEAKVMLAKINLIFH